MWKKEKEKIELQLKEIETFEKVARSFLFLTSALIIGLYYSSDIYKKLVAFMKYGKNKNDEVFSLSIKILNKFGFENNFEDISKLFWLFSMIVFFISLTITYALYVHLVYRIATYKTLFIPKTNKNKLNYLSKTLFYIFLLPLIIILMFISFYILLF